MRAYSAVFWERYRDLADWDRHIKNIEKGEARIKRQADIMHAVAVKLDRYRNPWQARICATQSRGRDKLSQQPIK